MNAPDPRLSLEPPRLTSKLPAVSTTIFTVMSALATKHHAINLGQGFPDFDCDPRLLDAVTTAMHAGALANQYPPMAGLLALREGIAAKIQALYGHRYDVASEITVTAGGTQGVFTAVLCAVSPGDEVIVIEPAYDCYLPAITLAGATPVCVAMAVPEGKRSYHVDWSNVAAAITPRTKMIIVNSPHNPTATAFDDADLDTLADLVDGTDIVLLSDEVYEHMVYDARAHRSLSGHARLAPRTFVVSSFGKTYHVTGWKLGYCCAPAALMAEFRKVHQFNVFTVNTPMQAGIAEYLRDPQGYLGLAKFYAAKRDRFRDGIARTRFKPLPCAGTYFQLVDYSAISSLGEDEFCRWLTTEIGVAAIPMSAFYAEPRDNRVVRFCFGKKDETIDAAVERLATI